MSEAQREAVDHWVRGAHGELLLADWLVAVEQDPPVEAGNRAGSGLSGP